MAKKAPKLTPEERAEREEQEAWLERYRDRLWQEIKQHEAERERQQQAEKRN